MLFHQFFIRFSNTLVLSHSQTKHYISLHYSFIFINIMHDYLNQLGLRYFSHQRISHITLDNGHILRHIRLIIWLLFFRLFIYHLLDIRIVSFNHLLFLLLKLLNLCLQTSYIGSVLFYFFLYLAQLLFYINFVILLSLLSNHKLFDFIQVNWMDNNVLIINIRYTYR